MIAAFHTLPHLSTLFHTLTTPRVTTLNRTTTPLPIGVWGCGVVGRKCGEVTTSLHTPPTPHGETT